MKQQKNNRPQKQWESKVAVVELLSTHELKTYLSLLWRPKLSHLSSPAVKTTFILLYITLFTFYLTFYIIRKSSWDQDIFYKGHLAKRAALSKSQHDKMHHIKQDLQTSTIIQMNRSSTHSAGALMSPPRPRLLKACTPIWLPVASSHALMWQALLDFPNVIEPNGSNSDSKKKDRKPFCGAQKSLWVSLFKRLFTRFLGSASDDVPRSRIARVATTPKWFYSRASFRWLAITNKLSKMPGLFIFIIIHNGLTSLLFLS